MSLKKVRVKQMKRNWKNFRVDKNKVNKFLGKTTLFISFDLMWIGLLVFGFLQNTIY